MLSKAQLNHYDLLEVHPLATDEELRAAYRQRSRELHPDRARGVDLAEQKVAAAKMAQVNVAYAILREPGQRALYDAELGRDLHAPKRGVSRHGLFAAAALAGLALVGGAGAWLSEFSRQQNEQASLLQAAVDGSRPIAATVVPPSEVMLKVPPLGVTADELLRLRMSTSLQQPVLR